MLSKDFALRCEQNNRFAFLRWHVYKKDLFVVLTALDRFNNKKAVHSVFGVTTSSIYSQLLRLKTHIYWESSLTFSKIRFKSSKVRKKLSGRHYSNVDANFEAECRFTINSNIQNTIRYIQANSALHLVQTTHKIYS